MIIASTWVLALALGMLRSFGVLLIMPLFTTASLGSMLLRNTIVLTMSLPILPLIFEQSSALPPFTIATFMFMVIFELLIGFTFGFLLALPFWAIEIAGYLIDTIRGATMATILNPTIGSQSSLFGLFLTQIVTALFLMAGGFNQVLMAIYTSYTLFPIGSAISISITTAATQYTQLITKYWINMFELSLSFALPAILIMVLIDVVLGLINRAAQQLNVFFLAMPIKSVLTLLLLIITLPFALHRYLLQMKQIETDAAAFFSYLRPPDAELSQYDRKK